MRPTITALHGRGRVGVVRTPLGTVSQLHANGFVFDLTDDWGGERDGESPLGWSATRRRHLLIDWVALEASVTGDEASHQAHEALVDWTVRFGITLDTDRILDGALVVASVLGAMCAW